ncbi:Uma2 family endonuclease [Phormidesmis sp. 146-33]
MRSPWKRDREAKLKLYSVRGVLEYWIVNWQTQPGECGSKVGGDAVSAV